MSDSESPGTPFLSVVGGAVIGAGTATLIATMWIFVAWDAPESITTGFGEFAWRVWSGVLVGGVTGTVLGAILAWHGAIQGATSDRADGVMIWGAVTGFVVGASLGPVFTATFGLALGHLGAATVIGLIIGPVAGIVSWQVGFFSADLFRGKQQE